MASTNRTCACCGDHYSYCPNCSGADRLAPPWKAEFCSETCKDLWVACTRYNMGKLTKSEAQTIINSLTLKPIEDYAACVQRDLETILKEEPTPKPKRGKRIMAQPIDDAVILEPTVVEEAIHEVVETEKE